MLRFSLCTVNFSKTDFRYLRDIIIWQYDERRITLFIEFILLDSFCFIYLMMIARRG